MNLSAIGWPQGALGSGYPDAPKNLLPGRIEGWPQGTQSSANEAERLLSTAVAWWDADHYEDGDKILRNRGIAGELLDLQLGSDPRVPTTNDPLYLAPEETGYVYLPGVAGNYLSVPDEAALDITGDIDIRVQVAMDDWTPGSRMTLAGKFTSGSTSWLITVEPSTGYVRYYWTVSGASAVSVTSSVAPGFSNGAVGWVKVTHDVDNNSSGNDVKFWTSTDGFSWNQLGVTRTTTGTTSIMNSTANVTFGQYSVYDRLAGKVYRAIVKDGIDGTTVLDVDCDAITDSSQTSFQAKTGQTVTINRSTSGRKSVAMPNKYPQKTDNGWSRGKPLFLFGTDDYMQVMNEWQHQLLNFDAGDSFTAIVINRFFGTPNGADTWLLSKDAGSTSNWTMYGATVHAWFVSESDVQQDILGGISLSAGDLNVRAVTYDSGDYTRYASGVPPVTTAATSDMTPNAASLRIGRGGTQFNRYADIEFTAAAIFRRALTPEEIATITNYYQTTAPGFQGEPEITAIDLLESSVFWIDPNISEIV